MTTTKLENLSDEPDALTFSVAVFTVVVCLVVNSAETSAQTDTNTAQKPMMKRR